MKAVNLLPPDLRGAGPKASAGKVAAPDDGKGLAAYAVLGVLACCVIALAAYVLTGNTVKDRRAQLEQVTADAQAAQQRAAKLRPYADFQQLASTRIQTVKDLAASRFDWEQGLRDISRAVPANVTLTSFKGSMSSQSGGGGALRTAISSPAIELAGCTTDQPSVATLLSRLRTIDGVTRVSLSKSEKPAPQQQTAGAASSSAGPSGSTADVPLCGRGRRPSFELVIFFERSKVPATIQDVTVTPTAAPAAGAAQAAGAQPSTAAAASPSPAAGAGSSTPASTSTGAGS